MSVFPVFTDALVNATDEIGARNNPHSPFTPALGNDRFDYNRDKLVNATDQIIARNNRTSPFTALLLITAPLEPVGGEGNGESLASIVNAVATSWTIAASTEMYEPRASNTRNDVAPVGVKVASSGPSTSFLQSLDLLYAKLDESHATKTREPAAGRRVMNTGDLEEFLDSMLNGVAAENELLATTAR